MSEGAAMSLAFSPDAVAVLREALEREIENFDPAAMRDDDLEPSARLALLLTIDDALVNPLGRHYGYADKQCHNCGKQVPVADLKRHRRHKRVDPLQQRANEFLFGFRRLVTCNDCR